MNGLLKPTQARIKFYDDHGVLITMITCGTEAIDHTIDAVKDQIYNVSYRNVAKVEVERF